MPEPTTLGRFLRRFTLGHIGQLNIATGGIGKGVDISAAVLLVAARRSADLD